MGLPLFIPPVESDVPSKSLTKPATDLSRTRSPIRRPERERRRHVTETRGQRLRMMVASNSSSQHVPGVSSQLSAPRFLPRPGHTHRASRGPSPGLENLPELTQRVLERRHDRARTATTLELPLLEDRPDQLIRLDSHPDALPSEFRRYASYDRPSPDSPARAERANEDDLDIEMARYLSRRNLERWSRSGPVDPYTTGTPRAWLRGRYVDGLGDRDRSLSPEGDEGWDTLQTTLTPDPQAPSIGSSFASTTTPAGASQTSGDNSVNTSMTTPNEDTEPPCDPVQSSGSDDDDDVEQQTDVLFQEPGLQAQHDPRSRQSPESPDTSDPDRFLSGMHRIVRALASRTDIPDEWWAQAGLSRSMSWDESN
ncbi:hypothetical protein F4861DRAFT_498826 [Xylaria intraflava]|nr:hypothetical protein F4861DRAFT_498826 [Xylaria intraflava]